MTMAMEAAKIIHDSGRALPDPALDQLFRLARTRNGWLDQPLPQGIIEQIYELAKWGPTAANTCPARFVFVTSTEGKARLAPHMSGANEAKVRAAPCTVIVAGDTEFYELMPHLFPARDMRAAFAGRREVIADTLQRNVALQGAYLMMAARALGLDCGPMSGFDNPGVDAAFFPDGRWRSNFLCSIGYGSDENLFDRNPRLAFEQACLQV